MIKIDSLLRTGVHFKLLATSPNNQLIIASHDLTTTKNLNEHVVVHLPTCLERCPYLPKMFEMVVSQSSPQESQTSGCSNTNLWVPFQHTSIDDPQYPHAGMPPNLSAPMCPPQKKMSSCRGGPCISKGCWE